MDKKLTWKDNINYISWNVPRIAHAEFLFKEQEILTFIILHKYQVAKFMFNFFKGDTSGAFIDIFIYLCIIPMFNIILDNHSCYIFLQSARTWKKEIYDMNVLSYGTTELYKYHKLIY